MRTHTRRWVLAVVWSSLVACGNDSKESLSDEESSAPLSAATLGEQVILSTADYLALEQFAGADRNNGARQAQICKACHSVDAGGPNMIGPALHGFFGRGVGEQAGFEYSPVMSNADFIWTPRALDAWLAQPGRFLPGNRMSFAGVFKQKDRLDLIVYLLEATSGNSDD